MKILSINGSPNRENGNTHQLLELFLAEAQKAGAEVESVFVADLDVKPCRGCFECWKSGGDCVIDDDMRWLLPKIVEADVVVMGAPLYVYHMPAIMKAIVDRTIPTASPKQVVVDGESRHLSKDGRESGGAFVLLSVCGFWEVENFDNLSQWMEILCRQSNARFAGKLLRPHAYAFSKMPSLAPAKGKVLKALKQAARELVNEGQISPETEAAVATDLISREAYMRAVNSSW
jgi:multimeric flavodoxin WrbA